MIKNLWLILIAILIIDFDLTAIVYGNRIVSIIALIIFLMIVAVAIGIALARF